MECFARCQLLYRIQSIDDRDQLKKIVDRVQDEDLVVINTRALTPRGRRETFSSLDPFVSAGHLTASKTILNYGQWFTFVYASSE